MTFFLFFIAVIAIPLIVLSFYLFQLRKETQFYNAITGKISINGAKRQKKRNELMIVENGTTDLTVNNKTTALDFQMNGSMGFRKQYNTNEERIINSVVAIILHLCEANNFKTEESYLYIEDFINNAKEIDGEQKYYLRFRLNKQKEKQSIRINLLDDDIISSTYKCFIKYLTPTINFSKEFQPLNEIAAELEPILSCADKCYIAWLLYDMVKNVSDNNALECIYDVCVNQLKMPTEKWESLTLAVEKHEVKKWYNKEVDGQTTFFSNNNYTFTKGKAIDSNIGGIKNGLALCSIGSLALLFLCSTIKLLTFELSLGTFLLVVLAIAVSCILLTPRPKTERLKTVRTKEDDNKHKIGINMCKVLLGTTVVSLFMSASIGLFSIGNSMYVGTEKYVNANTPVNKLRTMLPSVNKDEISPLDRMALNSVNYTNVKVVHLFLNEKPTTKAQEPVWFRLSMGYFGDVIRMNKKEYVLFNENDRMELKTYAENKTDEHDELDFDVNQEIQLDIKSLSEYLEKVHRADNDLSTLESSFYGRKYSETREKLINDLKKSATDYKHELDIAKKANATNRINYIERRLKKLEENMAKCEENTLLNIANSLIKENKH